MHVQDRENTCSFYAKQNLILSVMSYLLNKEIEYVYFFLINNSNNLLKIILISRYEE